MKILPPLVTKICFNHDAWIVGSAADVNNQAPRDYDVIVAYSNWQAVAALIPADAKPNTFGGWKCVENGIEIDIWPGDLGNVMANEMAKFAWHPKTNSRLVKQKPKDITEPVKMTLKTREESSFIAYIEDVAKSMEAEYEAKPWLRNLLAPSSFSNWEPD